MEDGGVYVKALGAIVSYFSPSPRPFIWSNKVTYRCVCKCGFCPFWRKKSKELSTGQQIELIDQAADLGVGFVAFEGGEPLLRDDIGILLAHAKKRSMITTLITNGWLFEERKDEVMGNIDVLVVSLDGPEQLHDSVRGRRGIFKRAIACRKYAGNKRFFFNAVLNEKNFDYVEDIVRIARENDAMVSFCPAFSYAGADDLRGSRGHFLDAIMKLQALKKAGWPIMNSDAFFRHVLMGRRVRCSYPRLFMNTNPEGKIVYPCPAWEGGYHPCEKVTGGAMRAAWNSPERMLLRKKGGRCTVCDSCRFIDSTEASLILNGDFGLLLEYLRIWGRIKGR